MAYGAMRPHDAGHVEIHVDDRVLLQVGLVADDDGRVVAADLHAGEHASVAADGHVAHDASRRRDAGGGMGFHAVVQGRFF